MSGLAYIDQSPHRLGFNLFDCLVDPGQFTVLDKGRLTWRGFELEAGIIGQSHYLRISGGGAGGVGGSGGVGGGHLCEVLACVPVESCAPPLASGHATELTGLKHDWAGYEYSFQSRLASWSDGQADMRAMQATTPGDEAISLSYHFPASGPGEVSAATLLNLRATGPTLTIDSLHCYPNHNKMVFTHSTLGVI